MRAEESARALDHNDPVTGDVFEYLATREGSKSSAFAGSYCEGQTADFYDL